MRAIFLSLLALALIQSPTVDQGIAAYKQEDYAQARTILQPLADNGDGRAQYYIGLLYQRGVGYPRNYVRAHVWFNLSAAKGVAEAAAARDAVEKVMTTQQRAEAEQLAIDWRPASAPPAIPTPSAPPPSPEPPRGPSRGPGSSTSSPSEAAFKDVVSYLSSRVRAQDADHSVPTVNIADCVLTVQHVYLRNVTVTATIEVGRITSASRYDSPASGLNVSIRGTSENDVQHTRSSGSNRTSRILQTHVKTGFDFEEFQRMLLRAKGFCSR